MMNERRRLMSQNTLKSIRFYSAFCILHSALALSLLATNGCDTAGALMGVVAQAIPRHVDAAYKGMAGQTVIVMVWMDRGLKADYPDLQMDIAASLQGKLIDVARDQKPDLLKGTVFPVRAATVIRNQDDHPEWDNESITTTAGKFDGTRLIYLEIKDYSLHAGAPELYRGTLSGDLKVLEMKDGKAKIAFAENDISVLYPKDSPKDGLPIGNDYTNSQGTVDLFTTEVAKRFYPHDEDRD
jgi:hypothetical protein